MIPTIPFLLILFIAYNLGRLIGLLLNEDDYTTTPITITPDT